MEIYKNISDAYYEKYNKKCHGYCAGNAFTKTTYFFNNHLELNYKSFYLAATRLDVIRSHQYFQLIYQLIFLHTYSFII